MDVLAQALDKTPAPGWKKCYTHLAYHFKVPQEVALRIQTNSTNNPSERLFFYLGTIKPDMATGVIKNSLTTLGRNDVVDVFNKYSISGEWQ